MNRGKTGDIVSINTIMGISYYIVTEIIVDKSRRIDGMLCCLNDHVTFKTYSLYGYEKTIKYE